jgi:carbonic anhydrase
MINLTHSSFMNTLKPLALAVFLNITHYASAGVEPPPSAAWTRLREGNSRFVSGQLQHPHQDAQRRLETAAGQKPFAVIIGCADSRASPEILFDQGLGDLFVVRLAGNVVDDAALGSVEFAVANLGARLIVVLGHEKCGAVQATLGVMAGSAPPPGHIARIVEAIQPAALAAKAQPGDPLENAITENIRSVAARLRESSPVLAPYLASGALQIVGARYDLEAGKVQPVR